MIAANFSSFPMPVLPVDKFADDRNVRLPKLMPEDLIYELGSESSNLSSINVEPKFKHTDERNLDFRSVL